MPQYSQKAKIIITILSVISAIALIAILTPFLWFFWTVSDFRTKYILKEQLNAVLEVKSDLCFGHNPHIHGGSIIYILKLTPEFSKRMHDVGIAIIKNRPPNIDNERWVSTHWFKSEELGNVIPEISNAITRIFSNIETATSYANNVCRKYVKNLKGEKFFVSFAHRKKYPLSRCTQDCQLYVVFPKSELVVISFSDG